MDSQYEALAAWVDGEPVARTEVAVALETREGRDYVLDLMALRHMVAVTTPVPSEAVTTRPARRWPQLAATAAAVALCAAGGFAAGRLLTPVPPLSSNGIAAVSTPAPISAPAPTRVIQLDEGTNWREIGGS